MTSRESLFAYFRGGGADLTVCACMHARVRAHVRIPDCIGLLAVRCAPDAHLTPATSMRMHQHPSCPPPNKQPEILNLVARMTKAAFPDHEPESFAPAPRAAAAGGAGGGGGGSSGGGGGDRLDCALAAAYLYYMCAKFVCLVACSCTCA